MGTDNYGRDVLSRVIAGAQLAMIVGVTSSFLGSTAGLLIGVLSGYVGGKTDMAIQRIMDMIMAFPMLVMAIAMMAVLGSSVFNVILAIAVPTIPRSNRVARSVAVSVKEFQYVEAARAVGASRSRIILRHVLPNCIAAYLIMVTGALGMSVLVEASLSFLGLGVPPPTPSWGRDLNQGMRFLYDQPWMVLFPGLAISLVVFGANLFGDAIRDVLDPRLKRM